MSLFSRETFSKRRPTNTHLNVLNLEARDVPAAYDLGAATDYNLVAFNDINVFNSDIEGRVAVGDDATLQSYGIGTGLPNSNGTRDDLIVGDELQYQWGQVFNGNLVYGTTANLDGVGIPNGTERQEANVFDFAALDAELTAKSTTWGAEAPNGLTNVRYGNIYLRGSHPTLDIFTLTPAQLNGAYSITIKAPSTATILINVPGTNVNIQNLGLHLKGVDCSQILWNFPDATEVNLSGVGLEGSFLAPNANFNFNNGQIEGTVIADSFNGNGELHICTSEIRIEIPEYSSLSGLVAIDLDSNNQYDPTIDDVLDGAAVRLTGIDSLGRRINRFFLTADGGVFNYTNLWPGNYTVTLTPPLKYVDNVELGIPGTVNGLTLGTPGINRVSSISLSAGDDGVNYVLPLLDTTN